MSGGIGVKRVRYTLAGETINYVKAVAPAVHAAPDVRDVKLPQSVRSIRLEEPAFRTNDVVFYLLPVDVTSFSIYSLYLLAIYWNVHLPRHLDRHPARSICGPLGAYTGYGIYYILVKSDLARLGLVVPGTFWYACVL